MNKFKTLMIAAATAATCLVASPAFAEYLPGEKASEQRAPSIDLMIEYLSIEQFVPSRLEFRKLSSDPVVELVKVAEGRYDATLRIRAVRSLVLYMEDARAVETVDALMTSVKPGARMFGPTLVAWTAMHGETVVDAVVPYATNESEEVRMAAVIALGRFGGQSGYDALLELKDAEVSEAVLNRINEMVN